VALASFEGNFPKNVRKYDHKCYNFGYALEDSNPAETMVFSAKRAKAALNLTLFFTVFEYRTNLVFGQFYDSEARRADHRFRSDHCIYDGFLCGAYCRSEHSRQRVVGKNRHVRKIGLIDMAFIACRECQKDVAGAIAAYCAESAQRKRWPFSNSP